MKIDLPAIAARLPDAPRRRGPVILPVINPTLALQGELAGIYLRVTDEWRRLAREIVMPAYAMTMREMVDSFTDAAKMSDDLGDVRNATEGAGEAAGRLLLVMAPAIRRWALRLERWHRLRWIGNIRAPTGVDLGSLIGPEDVTETIEATVAQNVALIRSVSDQARTSVAGIVLRGFQNRTAVRAVAKEVSAAIQVGRQRSLFIARDQATKLGAALDTERMQQVGITDFRWVSSGKVNYRPEHKRRNGRIYSFKKPPPDMPGQLPNCGCKKAAVLRLESGRWA